MKTKQKQKTEKEKDYFLKVIDQHKVDDITVDFFYRSHTVSLLLFLFAGLLLIAFIRDDNTLFTNYYHGGLAAAGIFLALSTMILPNGPFVRPHPAIWRIIFGASLLYFLVLVLVLFMNVEQARSIMHYLDPSLKTMTINDILDKEYAVNCSQLTFGRIYSHLDVFAFAHFFGWVVKAILLRHYWLTWLLSINWEITELAFCHMMPNFCECWWDSLFLDIIVCNGFGIFVGMKIVQWLEMRSFHWESVRAISSTRAKLKRVVMQFTPASWVPIRWVEYNTGIKRGIFLSCLVVVWQFAELNAFFLKHVFIVKPSHPFTIARLGLITLVSAPGIRQFYLFVTDPKIDRIGSQLWMFLAVIMTEFVVCLKFGYETFEKTMLWIMAVWFVWLVMTSFVTVFLCIWVSQKYNEFKMNDTNSSNQGSRTAQYVGLSHKFLNKLVSKLIRNRGDSPLGPASSMEICNDNITGEDELVDDLVLDEDLNVDDIEEDRNYQLYSESSATTNSLSSVMLVARRQCKQNNVEEEDDYEEEY